MAKINLLPWRAERRKARQQEFVTMLGIAAVAAVLISLMIVLYYNAQIDGQNNRNAYLTAQIDDLNKQIAEIKLLDEKKAGLLRRKQVIEDLQARRSQMVHLFDELARTIADGTQITSLQQNGAELALAGRAQSNARVSTYMRNLSASAWMKDPDLGAIQLVGTDPALPNEFTLKVTLKNPNDPAEVAAAAAAAGEVPADPNAPAPATVAPLPASSTSAPAISPPVASPPPGPPPAGEPAMSPTTTPAAPPATPAAMPPATAPTSPPPAANAGGKP